MAFYTAPLVIESTTPSLGKITFDNGTNEAVVQAPSIKPSTGGSIATFTFVDPSTDKNQVYTADVNDVPLWGPPFYNTSTGVIRPLFSSQKTFVYIPPNTNNPQIIGGFTGNAGAFNLGPSTATNAGLVWDSFGALITTPGKYYIEGSINFFSAGWVQLYLALDIAGVGVLLASGLTGYSQYEMPGISPVFTRAGSSKVVYIYSKPDDGLTHRIRFNVSNRSNQVGSLGAEYGSSFTFSSATIMRIN